MGELPHFKDAFARAKGQPRVGGVWQYYTAQVAQDLWLRVWPSDLRPSSSLLPSGVRWRCGIAT